MNQWPRHPRIYEINTWVWVHELGLKHHHPLTLGTIPPEEWDALGRLDIDAVWLMGVWERSPAGIRIARDKPGLQSDYHKALADYSEEDVVGSPYAIRRYAVDEHLGGPEGLAHARSMLDRHNIRLMLDFVPNHVARDHPWVAEHPEYFIQGDANDLLRNPESYFASGERIIACGRDPYFPPWTDTAQLNAFHPGLRGAVVDTLVDISGQCDGVRCDMAMLLINRVFEGTWGNLAGPCAHSEYWQDLIRAIRQRDGDFVFLGEAYWNLEWELQRQGFDYCYDKRLYDLMVSDDAEGIRLHLSADISYQDRLVRFIENHDEPRAAYTFPGNKLRAAALIASTLPGAKLFHEGQFEGRRVKLPVQLGRRAFERLNPEVQIFYYRLGKIIREGRMREADWRLCERSGWPDNASYLNIVTWCLRRQDEHHLIVVNLSDQASQARVRLPWPDLAGRSLKLTDCFNGEKYWREGSEMVNPGLYVDLQPWGFHLLSLGRC